MTRPRVVFVRVTLDEERAIRDAARRRGLTPASFTRMAALLAAEGGGAQLGRVPNPRRRRLG